MLALKKHSAALHAFAEELQEGRNKLTVIGAGIFIAIQLLLILLLSTADAVLYLAGFAVIIGLVQVFVRYPRVWIYTMVLGSLVYLTFESPEVDAVEIIFGIFYLGGILLWLFWQALIRKHTIIRHTGDWLLLFFMVVSLFNLVVATINSVDPIEWLREWNVLLLLLYYFPIREYFSSINQIEKLIFSKVVLVIGLCGYLTYMYYSVISQGIVYAYQYRAGGMQITETLFMSGIIFGVFSSIFSTSSKRRFKSVIFTALSVVSLILTFRRTYWLVTILCIIGALPFLRLLYQRRLFTYSIISAVFVVMSAFVVVGERGSQLFFNIVGQRFESSGQGTKDISLYARIIESQEALQHINELPLSGSGMRSPISFYEPILRHTKHNSYIHNGYIGNFHKLGIPLTILFLLPFAYFLWKGFLNMRKSNGMPPSIKVLAFGSFYSILGILMCNVTLSQFNQRTGLLAASFCIAFIEIVYNYRINNTQYS